MTPFDEEVLQLTMLKVRAWERLNDWEYCGRLNMADFHELLLEAGYNERAAQRAASQRGWERLSAGAVL